MLMKHDRVCKTRRTRLVEELCSHTQQFITRVVDIDVLHRESKCCSRTVVQWLRVKQSARLIREPIVLMAMSSWVLRDVT